MACSQLQGITALLLERTAQKETPLLMEIAMSSENGSFGDDGARMCSGRASARPKANGTAMLSRLAKPANRRGA